jgi:hypothetical protein
MNWAAHIWCWPTPATYSASGPAILPSRSMRPPAGEVGPVAGVVLALHRGDQLDQHLAAVADDRHVRHPVLGDLGRVDVGVHDQRVRREAGQLAGHPVVEPGAERDDEVRLLQRAHRGDGAVHAGHPQVLRVAVRERAAGHQRGDHRDPGELGEPAQLRRRVRLQHATADVQDRAPGLGDEPGGLADLLAVRLEHRPVAGQVHRRRPAEPGVGLQDVLGQVDQHRPGPAGQGQVERLGDRPRDLRGILDQEVVLRDRERDAADVGFLEGVRADRGRRHLAGDRDDRHRVHVRVGDRGDQVGRPRSRGRHADPDPAGGLRVPLRGVAGALLVPDQHVPDGGGVEQRVVRRQDRAAGDAEHDVRTDRLERVDE